MQIIEQTDAIRDFVFPLAIVSREEEPRFEDFVGTGFLIGNRGYALTAGHVLDLDLPADMRLVAMFVDTTGNWKFLDLISSEIHDYHDVGLLRLPPPNPTDPSKAWKSPFRLRNRWEGSSRRYDQWGYPGHALFDRTPVQPSDMPRPDLVYVSGYIRRRVAQEISDPPRGDCFYEVSEQAGGGCSGGPLYISNNRIWDVIGIYVGEKTFGDGITYSYAVNEECFRSWSPQNIDVTVLEESQNATP